MARAALILLFLLGAALAEAKGPTGDLPEIKKRRRLRVLVHGAGNQFLPRTGMPAEIDRDLALHLGTNLGVEVDFVLVESYGDLIPRLLAGDGDLIAAQMTVTPEREKKVAFTRPTLAVEEIVVGKQGAADLPRSVEGLANRAVHVRASSSYAQTLAALKEKIEGLEIVPVEESKDTETIVYEVTRGLRPLAVVDSHLLAAIRTYNPLVEPLFPIAEGREIAWAVRPKNPKLRAAADALIMERAMTGHTSHVYRGDLPELRKRAVIRVLTRNNPISYFLHKGQQFGFDYELAKMLAARLDLRLEIVVPTGDADLASWLLAGRGDLIAASYAITEERKQKLAFSKRYLEVEDLVVQKRGAPKVESLEALAGRQIHVRRSSSHRAALEALRARGVAIEIVEVGAEVALEALLDQVAEGKIRHTVADSHFVEMMLAYDAAIEGAIALSDRQRELGFAVRPEDVELRSFLDGFVDDIYRGVEFNMARKRYFHNARQVSVAQDGRTSKTGQISPYDRVFKKYATKYGLDWRLMAAQAYVESRFDPKAKSWVGARGLFQVMPSTGRSMGFSNLEDPEQGVHAGIKYMDTLLSRFEPNIPFRQRVRFALAAYNAGLGHVFDARRLAAELGLDPDRWFHNVEKAMLLLAEPQYAKRARHGYCRGGEPVRYVSRIQTHYDAYVKVVGP